MRSPTFERFGALPPARRAQAVRACLPVRFLQEAATAVGICENELLAAIGATGVGDARAGNASRLSMADGERLARLAVQWRLAYILYETEEGARAWLRASVPSVAGVPLFAVATEEGFVRARRSLLQLAYGVLA